MPLRVAQYPHDWAVKESSMSFFSCWVMSCGKVSGTFCWKEAHWNSSTRRSSWNNLGISEWCATRERQQHFESHITPRSAKRTCWPCENDVLAANHRFTPFKNRTSKGWGKLQKTKRRHTPKGLKATTFVNVVLLCFYWTCALSIVVLSILLCNAWRKARCGWSCIFTFFDVCLDSFAQAISPGVPLRSLQAGSTSGILQQCSVAISVENQAKFGNLELKQAYILKLWAITTCKSKPETSGRHVEVFLRWGFFRRLMVDVAWRKDSWVCGSRASEWIHLEAGLLEMTTSGNGRGKYQVKETRMVSLLAMDSEFFFFSFPANSKVC